MRGRSLLPRPEANSTYLLCKRVACGQGQAWLVKAATKTGVSAAIRSVMKRPPPGLFSPASANPTIKCRW